MNIASIEYSLETSSLDIYVSGCNAPHCRGCHNPELQRFDVGISYNTWIRPIQEHLTEFSELVDYIFIMGGEPLHQDPDHLRRLIVPLLKFNKKIVLFTRYDLQAVDYSIRDPEGIMVKANTIIMKVNGRLAWAAVQP